jgi:hypothetical protein
VKHGIITQRYITPKANNRRPAALTKTTAAIFMTRPDFMSDCLPLARGNVWLGSKQCFHRVTPVTAARSIHSYLGIIAMARLTQVQTGEHDMTKFYCLIAAAAVFLPVAMSTLNQAAMIVA